MVRDQKIELGDTAKDTLTGYTGVVVARTKWLHGCERLTLQSQKMKEGKPVDPVTFDEPQLVLVKSSVAKGSSETGGPRPEPTKHSI